MKLFKELSEKEEMAFRMWAREHYVPFTDIRGIWHPCVQHECSVINEEAEFMDGNPVPVNVYGEKQKL